MSYKAYYFSIDSMTHDGILAGIYKPDPEPAIIGVWLMPSAYGPPARQEAQLSAHPDVVASLEADTMEELTNRIVDASGGDKAVVASDGSDRYKVLASPRYVLPDNFDVSDEVAVSSILADIARAGAGGLCICEDLITGLHPHTENELREKLHPFKVRYKSGVFTFRPKAKAYNPDDVADKSRPTADYEGMERAQGKFADWWALLDTMSDAVQRVAHVRLGLKSEEVWKHGRLRVVFRMDKHGITGAYPERTLQAMGELREACVIARRNAPGLVKTADFRKWRLTFKPYATGFVRRMYDRSGRLVALGKRNGKEAKKNLRWMRSYLGDWFGLTKEVEAGIVLGKQAYERRTKCQEKLTTRVGSILESTSPVTG